MRVRGRGGLCLIPLTARPAACLFSGPVPGAESEMKPLRLSCVCVERDESGVSQPTRGRETCVLFSVRQEEKAGLMGNVFDLFLRALVRFRI